MVEKLEEEFFAVEAFDDVRRYYENYFAKNDITTLYKIRNWRERYHPEFLKDGEIYFSRPNELNDPFDITRPIKFDIAQIETPEFLNRLIESASEVMGINPGIDSKIYARNKLEEIRNNPINYFANTYLKMINGKWYNDSFGVFSLTVNILDEQLWGYYGGGLKGFAVGFHPMELCEALFLRYGQGAIVTYLDEILPSKIIGKSLREQKEQLFQKFNKWRFESEFRFVGRFTESQVDRFCKLSPKVVKEVILGPRVPETDKEEILKIVELRYPTAILYQVVCDYINGGIFKEQL